MNKRLIITLTFLAALSFVALGVFLFLQERPGVTRANCQRIMPGMTEAEVEAIFGEPKVQDEDVMMHDEKGPKPTWIGPDGAAGVRFDLNGKVASGVTWVDFGSASFLVRTLRWLHLD
jgi:hypothetical protein